MNRRPDHSAPRVSWSGVLAGALAATAIGLLGGGLPLSVLAVAAGGAIAGRIAGAAGLLQGTVVAVLVILLQGATGSLGPPPAVDLVTDTAATIGRDALLLVAGAAGGRLTARS
ncbi:MAG TPA: hypothetical protein VM070_06825 [Candidatus Saccharimonadales bacterium]|nr:hypothetical protein [Candidatus Saccharimonadales bacterium]